MTIFFAAGLKVFIKKKVNYKTVSFLLYYFLVFESDGPSAMLKSGYFS